MTPETPNSPQPESPPKLLPKLPPPSIWPATLALGIAFLVWGLITSLIITGVGVLLLAVSLAGWIRNIRDERSEREPNPDKNPAKKDLRSMADCGCDSSPSTLELSRRKFLARLSITAGGIGALILAVPTVGFIFAPLFERRSEVWRSVGKVESFKIGETTAVQFEDASPLPWAGVTARTAAWLRRVDADTFIAFSINCTHLGCPVRWLAEADLFMCPCHGGVYYQDGTVAAGPPPLPLPRYPVRMQDGEVQIQTSPIPITKNVA